MNEPFHESLTVWRFIRRHFVRIVIGAVLAVAVYGMLAIWMPYQRERRIAQKIEALGGYVVFKFAGPYWIPQSMWDRATLFNRVLGLDLYDDRITDAGMEHVKGLTNLIIVDLRSTQVTDSGLEHLKGLTTLLGLRLHSPKVTDAGLEHLKGLTNLKYIYLNDTQVTAEGRAMLRQALPNCRIKPDP